MKKYKCKICGKKVPYLHKGRCFGCDLIIETEIVKARKFTPPEQEKINEGLFKLIQLQQDTIDELVKCIDNETIKQRITTRREIYEKCRGAKIRDAYRYWKERL